MKKETKALLMVLMAFAIGACDDVGNATANSFKDGRDGKTYKVVKISKQTWMAENLNYEVKESKCHSNKPANCEKYGRLYY